MFQLMMLKGMIDVGLHLSAPLVRLGRGVDGRHWLPALSVEAEQRGGDHLQVQTIFAQTQYLKVPDFMRYVSQSSSSLLIVSNQNF